MIIAINGRVSLTVFSSYFEVQNMYWQGVYTFIKSAIIGGVAKLLLPGLYVGKYCETVKL